MSQFLMKIVLINYIDEVDIKRIVLSCKHSYGNKGSFKYLGKYI